MVDKTPKGEELDKKWMERLCEQAKNPQGPCHSLALRRTYYYQKKGIPYKLCRGTYDSRKHTWVEYEENGKWFIDDLAQGIKGWERKDCKKYSRTAVETIPDWRKNAG